jgi:hypothetical protein
MVNTAMSRCQTGASHCVPIWHSLADSRLADDGKHGNVARPA